MQIGTRILYPEEIDYWDADILQISVYRGMNNNMEFMRRCAEACKKSGKRYVIHPVKYSLLQDDHFDEIIEMADLADLALIVHDEQTAEGERINGHHEDSYKNSLDKLSAIAPVSIENSADTADIKWFWDSYAKSVTLDIGHAESSGHDSVEFVKNLEDATIDKISFVHMHRKNGMRGGITDHWPLTPGCREMIALRELIKRKYDVAVILELNEIEQIEESICILQDLRKEMA